MEFGLVVLGLAGGVVKAVSHPEAAESPEETKTEIPSPAACSNKPSQKSTLCELTSSSQAPKLMVITCAGVGVDWTMYCASSPIPPLAAEATTDSSVAPGATLPARITSRVAS